MKEFKLSISVQIITGVHIVTALPGILKAVIGDISLILCANFNCIGMALFMLNNKERRDVFRAVLRIDTPIVKIEGTEKALH